MQREIPENKLVFDLCLFDPKKPNVTLFSSLRRQTFHSIISPNCFHRLCHQISNHTDVLCGMSQLLLQDISIMNSILSYQYKI